MITHIFIHVQKRFCGWENEGNSNLCYNMDELRKHYGKHKRTDTGTSHLHEIAS